MFPVSEPEDHTGDISLPEHLELPQADDDAPAPEVEQRPERPKMRAQLPQHLRNRGQDQRRFQPPPVPPRQMTRRQHRPK
ncbi:hypothetical protein [Rhizohabitans arisaemae]|uniref:hypothetical protein n=1 Tax=Rhizohabitans arisaemae TaxID=2720610 RepID=UPI0024B17065|nr:hypothetical protein [Rhizohabitans arisaemae]